MANGSGPPDLTNEDYQTIKTGITVTGGAYDGTIKVGETHYWIRRYDPRNLWQLHSGEPESSQVAIRDDVWSKCKDGGSYNWKPNELYWTDPSSGKSYKWDGTAGEDVYLVEV